MQIAILAPSFEVATMANVVVVAQVPVEVATTMAKGLVVVKVLVEVAILAKVGAMVGVATINGLGGGCCQGAVVV